MNAAWILAAAAVVLVAHTLFALRARKRDVKAEKVSALEAIPDGIQVTHAPNPAKATRNGRSGMEFTWSFQTALASTVGELTIVEFGTLWWNGAQWQPGATVFGRPFTVAEFADWYACPNASLKRGTTYVDEQNYTGSDELKPSTSTWYFIGEGPDKQRYKGVAVVRLLAEIEDCAPTQQGAAPRGSESQRTNPSSLDGPRCKGRMTAMAVVENREAIARYLAHTGQATVHSRAQGPPDVAA